MAAAERERPDPAVSILRSLSDVDDSPEAVTPPFPLHEALALSRELLVGTHQKASLEAARLRARDRSLTLGCVWAGFFALFLLGAQMGFSSLPAFSSPGVVIALGIVETAAAILALGALGWRSAASTARKSILALHRAERCRLLKFRFLVDPNLWMHRGNEAAERRERFRTEAGEIRALTFDRAADWASRDTVAFAPTLPVGSGIDAHTVHTLVDYYQERRLVPQIDEIGRSIGRASARDAYRGVSSILFFAAIALVAIHAVVSPPLAGVSSLLPGSVWGRLIAAAAVILPALGLALTLSGAAAGSSGDRASLSGAHHALSELSGRLQKASGAEAIFRELGFCEDVLESHHREWLRGRLKDR
ncbi:MAG: hypothetical protein ACRD16_00695 [Thermoanaerobaculia bacterium]